MQIDDSKVLVTIPFTELKSLLDEIKGIKAIVMSLNLANKQDKDFTVATAADFLGVQGQTVRAYIVEGLLKSYTLPNNTIVRLDFNEVYNFREGLKGRKLLKSAKRA